MIAQRDNTNNLQKAETSAWIAKMTKEDSFAMFTLALMTILFLPGAWVAVSVCSAFTSE